jgi:hypothetical protein
MSLVDLHARWRVAAGALHIKHRWSLNEGAEVTGRVVATIRAGELAYADGEVLAPPGSGELLSRSARSDASSDPSPVSAQRTSAPL